MVNCLHKALTDKADYLTEETIDLHRAFKMLINDMKKEDWEVIKRQVCFKLKGMHVLEIMHHSGCC